MPRGRHRHSPPLHRLLPPSAIAGVSVLCAAGPWLFSQTAVLRGLAAGAAVTAIVGAVVMRHWDITAGKRVADLTRARAGDEWRHEERVAELETDLDESRELRSKLEQKLRAKRTELAGLRNEHAALLRRYATAETERASALEGRRLLAIEAGPHDAPESGDSPDASDSADAAESLDSVQDVETDEDSGVDAGADTDVSADAEAEDTEAEDTEERKATSGALASTLFHSANSALDRLARSEPAEEDATEREHEHESADDASAQDGAEGDDNGAEAVSPDADAPEPSVNLAVDTPVENGLEAEATGAPVDEAAPETEERADAPRELPAQRGPEDSGPPTGGGSRQAAQEDEVPAKPQAALPPPAPRALPTGHFTVPTAVAVVPAAPERRKSLIGGFDFFGTQKGLAARDVVQAVQNEDLADVVGHEALALHKAESESGFKPADEESRGVGQVIDLTAHDETEVIDVAELRSAVS